MLQNCSKQFCNFYVNLNYYNQCLFVKIWTQYVLLTSDSDNGTEKTILSIENQNNVVILLKIRNLQRIEEDQK